MRYQERRKKNLSELWKNLHLRKKKKFSSRNWLRRRFFLFFFIRWRWISVVTFDFAYFRFWWWTSFSNIVLVCFCQFFLRKRKIVNNFQKINDEKPFLSALFQVLFGGAWRFSHSIEPKRLDLLDIVVVLLDEFLRISKRNVCCRREISSMILLVCLELSFVSNVVLHRP